MKRNKEDFFEQMEKYGTAFGKHQFVVIILGGLFSLAALIILILGTTEKIVFTQSVLITMLTFFGLALLTVIYYYASFFKRNNALFIKGSLSAGITNLSMILIILFFILFVLFMSLPEYKDIFLSIFTFATTISTATLTMMGVYYTLKKHQDEHGNGLNLIFNLIKNDEETTGKLYINNASGDISIKLNLKNISNNFGYVFGIYRICGCDIYQIGDKLPYFPIAPHTAYSFSNIKVNLGDDQIIFVYTDINENYYYLLLSSDYKQIESIGKCDMDFLEWRLDMTEKSEQKSKNKLIKQPSTELLTDENFINGRKEATKPINTIRENGFDLVVSSNGTILTDKDLLNKLKKERIRLAKEQKVKAYMIFNNQQLVALATYKPIDELSFISIYGLGKKKFELYGDLFLSIIAEHSLVAN